MTTARRSHGEIDECWMIGPGTKRPFERLFFPTAGACVRKDETMRKLGLAAALAATVAVTGCATYPDQYGYGYGPGYYNNGYNNGYYGNGYNNGYYGNGYNNSQGASVATGAAVGGVAGALVTHSVGGAVAGAVLGGVLGAVVNGRQYYRDTRGYCYYVDQYGNPHYSYDTRC